MALERIESRGVRCLECSSLDLQANAEAAKNGFGQCRAGFGPWVTFANARNCRRFEPAPAEQVAARDAWADKVPMFWQRK